jgi:hypothetical protein
MIGGDVKSNETETQYYFMSLEDVISKIKILKADLRKEGVDESFYVKLNLIKNDLNKLVDLCKQRLR